MTDDVPDDRTDFRKFMDDLLGSSRDIPCAGHWQNLGYRSVRVECPEVAQVYTDTAGGSARYSGTPSSMISSVDVGS
jgi:hypothetical protein